MATNHQAEVSDTRRTSSESEADNRASEHKPPTGEIGMTKDLGEDAHPQHPELGKGAEQELDGEMCDPHLSQNGHGNLEAKARAQLESLVHEETDKRAGSQEVELGQAEKSILGKRDFEKISNSEETNIRKMAQESDRCDDGRKCDVRDSPCVKEETEESDQKQCEARAQADGTERNHRL